MSVPFCSLGLAPGPDGVCPSLGNCLSSGVPALTAASAFSASALAAALARSSSSAVSARSRLTASKVRSPSRLSVSCTMWKPSGVAMTSVTISEDEA